MQLSDGREFEKPAQCPGILISLFRGRVGFRATDFFLPPSRHAALNHAHRENRVLTAAKGERERERGVDRSNPHT